MTIHSILLALPGDICKGATPHDNTYFTGVVSADLEEVVREARASAADEHEYDGPLEDYQVLLAIEGIHHDLSTGEE